MKANCPHMVPGPTRTIFLGVFLRDPGPYIGELRKKKNNKENSQRLDRQARAVFEPVSLMYQFRGQDCSSASDDLCKKNEL